MEAFQLKTVTPVNLALRGTIETMIRAALTSADPALCVRNALVENDGQLAVLPTGQYFDISEGVVCIGVGKASLRMTAALVSALAGRPAEGICVTKAEDQTIHFPGDIEVIRGGHPQPTEASVSAARQIDLLIRRPNDRRPIVCLISGGGSALMVYPAEGISLIDYQQTNQYMLADHLSIDETNTVRKHIDRLKGGGLLQRIAPRTGVSLILSDVVSGDLGTIASGPTVPDRSTFREAIQILESVNLWVKIPEAVRDHLQRGARGALPETLKPGEGVLSSYRNTIVGGLRQSMEALAQAAESQGYAVDIRLPYIAGDLDIFAERISADIQSKYQKGVQQERCLIYGGEGTVRLTGSGRGGRNSHLAAKLVKNLSQFSGVSVVTFASDGEDGNSPGAGAVVTDKTYTRALEQGLDVDYHIAQSNTYEFFRKLGDAIETGSTGTNVNDLVFVLMEERD